LIEWVPSFSKVLLHVKFVEDKVLVFVILREKCEFSATVSLTLILTLISTADWWYIGVVLWKGTLLSKLLSNKSGSIKERIQTTMPRPDSWLVAAHFVCPWWPRIN